ENTVGEVWIIPGPRQTRQYGQVTAQQLPLCGSMRQCPDRAPVGRIHRRLALKKQLPKLIEDHGRPSAIRHCTVKRDQSRLGMESLMERRNIAITQKNLGVTGDKLIIEFIEQSGSPRSSPQTDNSLYLRIRKHIVQVINSF